MAITTIANPQGVTPAFNPMYFYFDSTSKTEQGFKYLVTVTNQTTSEIIGTYKLKPIPTSLYGEVDISKLVQTQLYNDFQELTSYIPAGHQLTYKLNIKETYFISAPFTSYSSANNTTWPNFSNVNYNPSGYGRTRIAFSTLPPYSIGDEINISQTIVTRPELEGIHTVLDIYLDTGVYYVVLDLIWIKAGTAASGTTTFADGRKSIIDGIDILGLKAYKGAFKFLDFINYLDDDYILDQDSKLFLTTLPDGVKISRENPTWLSGYVATGTQQYLVFVINGTQYRYPVSAINGKTSLFNILPSDAIITETWVGSSWVAFGGGLDMSDVEEYTIQFHETSNPVSVLKTITLYSECDFHEKMDLTFLDRLGSWITIPFYKGIYLNQDVTRSTSRKKYGDLNISSWEYNSKAKGDEVYHIEENISYTINTGQLSEVESQYMRELVGTSQAYITINNGEPQAIKIETSSQPLHKKRTKRDRKVSINFKMAVQDPING